VIPVGIISGHEAGQARQVVIRTDWAESDMLGDLDVKPDTGNHRKPSSLSFEIRLKWL
jgi:hypothetical protein